ncbi:MAG: hypothetical protein QXV82_08370, partial [Ignisphaera sp.]
KGKDLFVPLKKIAEVRRGFTTGANEFFYLTEEKIRELGIEREFWMHPVKYDEWLKIKDYIPEKDVWIDKGGEYFKQSQYSRDYKLDDVLINGNVIWIPNYVIKSPRECKSIIVNPKDLKYRVLLIHKDKKDLRGTNVLKYIEWGEEQGFHKRPTCAARQRWYELERREFSNGFWMMTIRDRFLAWLNPGSTFVDARLYDIYVHNSTLVNPLFAFLNSTLNILFVELSTRSYGGGGGPIDVKVYEVMQLLVPDLYKVKEDILNELSTSFTEMLKRDIETIFGEIGSNAPENISLNKVKRDRRKLDEIIMGKILGLTIDEQLQVYKSVIDLVKSRIEKAKSFRKRWKKKEINFESILYSVINRLNDKIIKIKKFPEDYLIDYHGLWSNEIKIPKGKTVSGADLSGFYVQVDGERIYSGWSEKEAKFVYYAALTGSSSVKIPLDKHSLEKALEAFEKDYERLKKDVNDLLLTTIPDAKIRAKVEDLVWKKIFSQINLRE